MLLSINKFFNLKQKKKTQKNSKGGKRKCTNSIQKWKDRTLQITFIRILEFAEVTLEDTGLIFEMTQRDRRLPEG